MKLKFKHQPYQSHAVESVVDCFAGQENTSGAKYRIDPGVRKEPPAMGELALKGKDKDDRLFGFENAAIELDSTQLLKNIHAVQKRQNLPLSDKLALSADCTVNLDVDTEYVASK